MKNKGLNIAFHVIACLVFLSLPVLLSPDILRDDLLYIPPFQRDFMTYLLVLIFFYINYYFLIPKYYTNKKYLAYISIVIIAFLLIEFIPRCITKGGFHMGPPPHMLENGPPMGPAGPPRPGKAHFLVETGRHFFLFMFVVFLSLMLKTRELLKKAQREKSDAELSYLKAQINPHFLFNTLNSIYSLAIDKSDYTATAVVKLSGMMRYVLSEANNEFVSLEKEIRYISDFIELQKLRLGNTVRLNYNVHGNISGKQIAPLILIPFIENAFKYGVNPEENSEIIIEIAITENNLNLSVRNNKVKVKTEAHEKSGLGIANTKSRLQLLYPGKHYLTLEDNEKDFHVSLSIKL
jgi:hypothetical protein